MDVTVPQLEECDRTQLIQLVESLIDCDTVVDDARDEYWRAEASLAQAISSRNSVAHELTELLRRLPAALAA